MRLVRAARASTLLHDLLRSQPSSGPWLLPANVCPIVPLTFLKAGRVFEFVDIERETLCMDRAEALVRLREAPDRYAGLLFVRTYGLEDEFDEFFADIARVAPPALLVDDRCLCPPSFAHPDAPVADVMLYSTGYAKTVDVGFGGFAWLADRVAHEPCEQPYREEDLERLTLAYKAAIKSEERLASAPGDWLDTRPPALDLDEYRRFVERALRESLTLKARINRIYDEAIPERVRLDDRFQRWRYHLVVSDKRRLLAAIFERGLFASSHYADLTPVFAQGRSPVAARFHASVVNLFNDRYFDEEKAGRIAAIVREHLGI